MASSFVLSALTLTLGIIFGCAYANLNKCNTYTIRGTSTFVNGQNVFLVVPYDSGNRDGGGGTFAAPLSGSPGCIYQGVVFDTGALGFLIAQLKCGNDRVEFMGDESLSPGSTTTFAIVGGTGLYTGATGTVTQVTQGNLVFQLSANIIVCN